MEIPDTFWQGFMTGILVATVVAMAIGLGSCDYDRTYTLPYEREREECVVKVDMIINCYPVEAK